MIFHSGDFFPSMRANILIMRSFFTSIILISVGHAVANKHATDHITAVHELTGKLDEMLIDRALEDCLTHGTDLDETAVGKPNRLVSRSFTNLQVLTGARNDGHRKAQHHFRAKDATFSKIGKGVCEGQQYTPQECFTLDCCYFNSKFGRCIPHLPSRRAMMCAAAFALAVPSAHAARQVLLPLELYLESLNDALREMLDLSGQLAFQASVNLRPDFTELGNRLQVGDLGNLEQYCEGTDEYLCGRSGVGTRLMTPGDVGSVSPGLPVKNICPKKQPSDDLLSSFRKFRNSVRLVLLSENANIGARDIGARDLQKQADDVVEKLSDYISEVGEAQARAGPKPAKQDENFVRSPSGLLFKDVKKGTGKKAKGGDRCVLEWTAYIVDKGGQPVQFQAKQRTDLSKGDEGYLLFELGKGNVIPAIEECVALNMQEGGVRQLVVDTPALGYPKDDPLHTRVGPKPATSSGQSALNSLLEAQNTDKTLLFNIKLIRVDKPGQNGWKEGQITPFSRDARRDQDLQLRNVS
eukprot:gnl/MRDRNA2_/MRDRNA2_129681_c0_seq1.p1 gnl/MRDRNA2_/MRDRNA2_129681_c0~~gnl/MRDRNA2_/MRDRNA2_129681_c0_seq1.p1  ORF type:complete len:524 (+),score=70.63 gnl/MRDRNA2_/MRDRNA2_129681_c0_seq1:63-1634(+)